MQEVNQSTDRRQQPLCGVPQRTAAELAAVWDRLRAERVRQAAQPPSRSARDRILRAAVAKLSMVIAQQVVRGQVCLLCQAPPDVRCTSGGDHLRRWLDSYTLGLVTRADIAEVICGLVFITKWRVVPDRVATAPGGAAAVEAAAEELSGSERAA